MIFVLYIIVSLKSTEGFESDVMSNIGRTGLEGDINKAYMWYKMATYNDSNFKIIYENLNLLSNSKEDSQFKKFVKQSPFNSKNIPDSLISEAQKAIFFSDLYRLLNQYSAGKEIYTNDLKKKILHNR